MSTPLLTSSNLTYDYGNTRRALRDVEISLNSGELVALLGPNGSGKSTLIKSLLGHLHAKGKIEWEGIPLKKWNRRALARRVAYLPQSPSFESGQKVIDTLRLGRSPYWSAFGIESDRDQQVVQSISTRLALDDLLNRPMDELSGGQRQRVFIGRCLVQEPAAMLLDEPNTYLDLKHQFELCQLLRTLAKDQSLAILMASHDLNLAAAFADRVVLLNNGTVAAAGDLTVLQPELLSKVYGLPMTRVDRDGAKPLFVPAASTT
jgi:ABC-type cobalamin/Fe3+-siderophores transport system ATPase subunit